MITLRSGSPRSANAARMSIRPVSSPCDPAAGWSVTAGQPRDLGEDLLELPHQLERALRARRPPGAGGGRGSPGCPTTRSFTRGLCFIVQLPERVEARVDAEVAVGELREVAHDLVLGHLGEARRAPHDGARPGSSGTGRSYEGTRPARRPGRDFSKISSISASPPRGRRRAGRCRQACASR